MDKCGVAHQEGAAANGHPHCRSAGGNQELLTGAQRCVHRVLGEATETKQRDLDRPRPERSGGQGMTELVRQHRNKDTDDKGQGELNGVVADHQNPYERKAPMDTDRDTKCGESQHQRFFSDDLVWTRRRSWRRKRHCRHRPALLTANALPQPRHIENSFMMPIVRNIRDIGNAYCSKPVRLPPGHRYAPLQCIDRFGYSSSCSPWLWWFSLLR